MRARLADSQDLSIHTSDIQFSKNVPQAGDSLTISATVHNNSSTAAIGIAVDIVDRRSNALLGTSTVDLAAESSVMVRVPWVPTAPDSHDIQLQVRGSPVSVELGIGLLGLRFDPPYPNPASRSVVFSFTAPRRSAGALDVYDILGRRVRGWRWTGLLPGKHSVEWDGHGTSGQRLSPGVYLCRLSVGDERLQRKVILRH